MKVSDWQGMRIRYRDEMQNVNGQLARKTGWDLRCRRRFGMELSDGIKKFFLLGVGAAAASVEKSTEIVDELVKKGELTVEQGKAFDQELKHNIKESSEKAKAAAKEKTAEKKDDAKEEQNFNDLVAGLSEEDLAKLKDAIAKKEEK